MEAARIVNSKQQRFGTNLFFDIGAKLARLDPLMRGLSVKIVPRKWCLENSALSIKPRRPHNAQEMVGANGSPTRLSATINRWV